MELEMDTGEVERIIVGEVPLDVYLEHIGRYVFAADFVKERTILDVACGTGYGSFYLAQHGAKQVIGMDISEKCINYAMMRYRADNLQFYLGDANQIPFHACSFDVIISFETLEHLSNPEKFLAECNRVLNKNSLIIISTPNKWVHEKRKIKVPYHKREFSKEEFTSLIEKQFYVLNFFGQRPVKIEKLGSKDAKISKIASMASPLPQKLKDFMKPFFEAFFLNVSVKLSLLYYRKSLQKEKKLYQMTLPREYKVLEAENISPNEVYKIFIAVAKP